ncbi:MAG: hypothetical protein IPK16_09275 [Anaerolineales bacterium]|nr:hypothetical protein [Anaerolineales bacterium]
MSSEAITPSETVLLGTQITGEDIGFIYIDVARYDEESDSFSIEGPGLRRGR